MLAFRARVLTLPCDDSPAPLLLPRLPRLGLTFAVAASANFPALFLSIFWRRFTTAGACWSMWVGTLSAVGLIVLCPSVWVDILHHAKAPFPLKSPGIVTIPLSFAVAVGISLLTREPGAEERFEAVRARRLSGTSNV